MTKYLFKLLLLSSLLLELSFCFQCNRNVRNVILMPKPSNYMKTNNKFKLTMGVEHLVECNVNGATNGFINYDMCLDHDMNHVIQMLFVDMFERIITIGILVATYFYFKRLAVTDPVNSAFVPKSNSNNNENFDFSQEYCKCPKCNGTGRNLFKKGLACDLCGGSGEIDIPQTKVFNLPDNNNIDDDKY